MRCIGLSLTLLLLPALGGEAEAARICKDGYVVYTGSAAASTRPVAEASALRAWQATQSLNAQSRALDKVAMRCVLEGGERYWRCHVRAGPCSKV